MSNLDPLKPAPTGWHYHSYGGGLVQNTATVSDTAFVGPGARVCENAQVLDNAVVRDEAVVTGSSILRGCAQVRWKAEMSGFAQMSDNSSLGGHARLGGHAQLSDNAEVWSDAVVKGHTKVSGDAEVWGNAVLDGATKISGNAFVDGNEVLATLWTDYPFIELGDVSGREAPIRSVEFLRYDGNKMALIRMNDIWEKTSRAKGTNGSMVSAVFEIKWFYLYTERGRNGEVPVFEPPEAPAPAKENKDA